MKGKKIIAYIAMQEHTTEAEVRAKMMAAMAEGQRSTDPAVQALWDAIPKSGVTLTPEELIEYLASLEYS